MRMCFFQRKEWYFYFFKIGYRATIRAVQAKFIQRIKRQVMIEPTAPRNQIFAKRFEGRVHLHR